MTFYLTYHKSQNRIYVEFSGFIKISDEKDFTRKFQNILRNAQENVTIVMDMRNFNLFESIDYFSKHSGSNHPKILGVAWIYPKNPISIPQLDKIIKFHKQMEHKFFDSNQEAEIWLDSIQMQQLSNILNKCV